MYSRTMKYVSEHLANSAGAVSCLLVRNQKFGKSTSSGSGLTAKHETPPKIPDVFPWQSLCYACLLCGNGNGMKFDSFSVQSHLSSVSIQLNNSASRIMQVRQRVILGTFSLSSGYSDKYYKRAQGIREGLSRDFSTVFEKLDVLVCPTAPTTAYR